MWHEHKMGQGTECRHGDKCGRNDGAHANLQTQRKTRNSATVMGNADATKETHRGHNSGQRNKTKVLIDTGAALRVCPWWFREQFPTYEWQQIRRCHKSR